MATEAAKRVGQRILQARREMGLNQRELAERFKTGDNESAVTNQHISNWERGVNAPSPRYMEEFVRITGHELSWFYTEPDGTVEANPDLEETPDLMGALSSRDDSGLADRLERVEEAIRKLLEAQEHELVTYANMCSYEADVPDLQPRATMAGAVRSAGPRGGRE